MAYDPNVLRSMLSPPPAFGGHAGGAAPTGGAPGAVAGHQAAAQHQQAQPQAEPVALHEASVKAQEALAAARAALEDLAGQGEMADTIDPSVEKAISAASDAVSEADDSLQEIVGNLLSAREDHEKMASDGDGDGDEAKS